jgi:hypothetical protein
MPSSNPNRGKAKNMSKPLTHLGRRKSVPTGEHSSTIELYQRDSDRRGSVNY